MVFGSRVCNREQESISVVQQQGEMLAILAAVACGLLGVSPCMAIPQGFAIGLDPGAPIVGAEIAFRGDLIQSSRSTWVRINFILGPWTAPDDASRRGTQSRTWYETYDQIINDAVSRGLEPYGLIGAEAVRSSYPLNSDGYVADYVRNFVMIVNRYKDRMKVYESFNEPNDWAGGTSAQVTPYYFAKMLESIYRGVKIDNGHATDPAWQQVLLVSGPVFSHEQDTVAPYFTDVYNAGIGQLGWSQLRQQYGTYPFDGVGYHIYVAPGSSNPNTIRSRMSTNLNAIWGVITQFEGANTPKRIWLSEIGWNTAAVSEEAQAQNVDTAINHLRANGNVIMVSWFCLRDFGWPNLWGLERADGSKKPGWTRFVAQAQLNVPTFTPTQTLTPAPSATPTRSHTPSPTPTIHSDQDGDRIDDLYEGFPPASGESNRYLPDSDGDGLWDGIEDRNRNGRQDAGETGTRRHDSDGDSVEDGVEVLLALTDPLDPSQPAAPADEDGDGLPWFVDLNDTNPDSDGDRYTDGYEAVMLRPEAAHFADEYPALGDVTGDRLVTNVDALALQAVFLSLMTMETLIYPQGDVNRDGLVSNVDGLIAQSYFLHLLSSLPAAP